MKNKTIKLVLWVVPAVAMQMTSLGAWAGSETKERVEQLRQNAENSRANLEQYKKNLAIVNTNLAELNKAISSLDVQKEELHKTSNNSEKNKAALQEIEKNIASYRQEEQRKLDEEQKQINELQTVLKKLEDNKNTRESNIAAYNKKLDDLKAEKSDWNNQSGSLNEISVALDAKRAEASKERQKWQEKQKSYHSEVDKWDRQASYSDRTYKQFQNMK